MAAVTVTDPGGAAEPGCGHGVAMDHVALLESGSVGQRLRLAVAYRHAIDLGRAASHHASLQCDSRFGSHAHPEVLAAENEALHHEALAHGVPCAASRRDQKLDASVPQPQRPRLASARIVPLHGVHPCHPRHSGACLQRSSSAAAPLLDCLPAPAELGALQVGRVEQARTCTPHLGRCQGSLPHVASVGDLASRPLRWTGLARGAAPLAQLASGSQFAKSASVFLASARWRTRSRSLTHEDSAR